MLWIIGFISALFVAAGLISFAITFGSWKTMNIKRMAMILGISIVTCFGSFYGLFGIIDSQRYEEKELTAKYELVSLSDNIQYVNLSVGEQDIYSYYYRDGDGIRGDKVKAKDTIIYEQDSDTAYMVEYTIYTKNKINSVARAILGFGYGVGTSKEYEIFVPKNSVISSYELNAQ